MQLLNNYLNSRKTQLFFYPHQNQKLGNMSSKIYRLINAQFNYLFFPIVNNYAVMVALLQLNLVHGKENI